jgi:hypothetical protein
MIKVRVFEQHKTGCYILKYTRKERVDGSKVFQRFLLLYVLKEQ